MAASIEQEWLKLQYKINPIILNTLRRLNFSYATPVQAACIPLLSQNKDVAVEAVTGSGKTLAFVIPALEILLRKQEALRKNEVGVLIISPTRELATQISGVVEEFLQELQQFTHGLFIGGNNPDEDMMLLHEHGCHIMIATPGRLEELLGRRDSVFNLAAAVKALEVLVLDEADRILDLGFEASINTILSYLPKLRRTGLFSATQTEKVIDLIRAGLRNPVKVRIVEKHHQSEKDSRIPLTLQISSMICESDEKINQLVHFLKMHKHEKHIIFFSTCASVDYFTMVFEKLLPQSKDIVGIHGKMQKKRAKLFEKFKNMKSGILTCTDVMARGVDIPNVHYVIQFDPPSTPSSFVHRCGRTARIGHEGKAIVFLRPHEDTYVQFIAINQKVPLQNLVPEKVVADVVPKLRKYCLSDRALYEKSIRAFVSFIKSYSKHDCNLIFRFKDMNIAKLAYGFGLLHLPFMPELKNRDVSNFVPTDKDLNQIKFKDKHREKQHKEKMKLIAEGKLVKRQMNNKKNRPWSENKMKLDVRKDRRDKRILAKKNKRKHVEIIDEEEVNELNKDTALLKKLKKKRITNEEFDEKFTGNDAEQENLSTSQEELAHTD